MKMTELLDKDKNNLVTELGSSLSPEKAVKVLEAENDKLLLRYNEQCESEPARLSAAYLMQALRLSLPLIDTAGNTKVWEHESGKESKKSTGVEYKLLAAVLLILGIFGAAYALIPLIQVGLAATDSATHQELIMRIGAACAGILLAFIGGLVGAKKVGPGKKEYHVEIRVDADKIYRYYRTMLLSVDQSLDEIMAKERWDNREKAGTFEGRQASPEEIELFSDLLAAAYSGDAEYALEKIDNIKYYLHKQQIEVVDYSDSSKQYFDMMPGTKNATIRPAMVADGTLLKKGLASSRK